MRYTAPQLGQAEQTEAMQGSILAAKVMGRPALTGFAVPGFAIQPSRSQVLLVATAAIHERLRRRTADAAVLESAQEGVRVGAHAQG